MKPILTKITSASELPVTLAECKADLRVENTAEDTLIDSYIAAATAMCSEVVGKKFVNEVWKAAYPSFNYGCIELPFVDISALTEVQYYDTDDVSQTLNTADFYVYAYETKTVFQVKDGVTLPGTKTRNDAVSFTFTTGYGVDASAVPETIKRAIRLLVAHWFRNREAVTSKSQSQSMSEIPFGVDTLLSIERIGWCA